MLILQRLLAQMLIIIKMVSNPTIHTAHMEPKNIHRSIRGGGSFLELAEF
jgi:hypothetical protein